MSVFSSRSIDNHVHAHPGFDVSLIVKLLRNWDRENGLFVIFHLVGKLKREVTFFCYECVSKLISL